MIERLKHFLKLQCLLNEQELDVALQYFKRKKVAKNSVLLFKGEVCNNLYFIDKGCVRTYFITKNHIEKTRFVGFDGNMVTAFSSFISQKPSLEYVDALEDTELWLISYHHFYLLKETLPGWANFYTKFLESAYLIQSNKIENLMTLSAKERFENTVAQNPQLLTRLSNRVLASYLDISQETLSRIKSM